MGAGGVLIVVKQRGILPAVRPVLDVLLAAGFRLRWDVRAQILADGDETE
jgi:predicted nucleic acid-binding protein